MSVSYHPSSMFRQGSLRDERRRRALMEDALACNGEASSPTKTVRSRAPRDHEAYTELARIEHQWRVTDVIPRTPWGLAAWLFAGIALVAAVEGIYWLALESWLADAPLPSALNLAERDSLGGYASALVLLGSSAFSLLIYVIRRHRADDYRGRYRAWMCAAVLWCLASVDAVADLRLLAQVTGTQLTGHAGPGGGLLWWLAPWIIATAYVALRTAIDLRRNWIALVSFALAFTCWAVGLIPRGAVWSLAGSEAAMLGRGLSLGGDWLLLWSSVVYARFVLLEAHGLSPQRRTTRVNRESRKAPAKRDDLSGNEPIASKPAQASSVRIDTPHAMPPTRTATTSSASSRKVATTPTPVARLSASVVASSASKPPVAAPTGHEVGRQKQFADAAPDDRPSGKSLSRAERKRLRREQRALERGE